ncbi:Endo-1,4-beta-xylanase 2, partial [Frankliniella fusca]
EKSREGVKKKRHALGEALLYVARPKTYIPPLLCALTTDHDVPNPPVAALPMLRRPKSGTSSCSVNSVRAAATAARRSLVAHPPPFPFSSPRPATAPGAPGSKPIVYLVQRPASGRVISSTVPPPGGSVHRATDLHSRLGCRDEIDILHPFGLLVSYHEAKRHEFTVAMFKSENEGRVCEVQRAPRAFTQYVFDNFDHDTSTLDGHGTVHVLGGQRIVTLVDPTAEVKVDCIPRRALPSSASQIAQDLNYAMDIVWLKGPVLNGLKSVQPMTSTSLYWDPSGPSLPPFIRDALTVDSLWMAGRWAGALPSAPSWLGYMKRAMTAPDRVLPRSTVQALPFVELATTDPNAINTALRYAMKDADDRGQDDCFVTFDQPLYMKAMKLVTADPALSGVQVRLGGFHLTMSYLGSIAHIMSGSGLEEVWAQVYAFNSIKHMVTGKAYSRAVRAHFLVQEAIGSMLLDRVIADATRRSDIRELYGDFLERADVTAKEVANTPVARRLGKDLIEAGEQAASDSATGTLWWQYFKLVALLRFHIRAERTGDWEMHKESVKAMLPIFHAAGHLPYARAAHLYVQQMEELTGGCQGWQLHRASVK